MSNRKINGDNIMFKNTGVRVAKHGACDEIEGSPRFRSGWERNVYRFLLRTGWKLINYEKFRFTFDKPFRRAIDYCPDFTATEPNGMRNPEYEISGAAGLVLPFGKDWIIEVKGRLDGQSKTRLMGFKKYYPHLEDHLLIITRMRDNAEWFSKNLPKAVVWDYDNLKRQVGRMCQWE